MNAFLTELDLTPLSDGRNWKLLSPLLYCVDAASEGEILTIPTDFVTDLASVPRTLWNIYPPFGVYDSPSVLHDYGYRNGGVYVGAKKVYTKADVDNLFRDSMKACGVGLITRNILYTAVKLFGQRSFKKV